MSDTIRVLVFKDADAWVAQCLEYDIGAQAADPDTLRDRLYAVLSAELEESLRQHGEAFAGIEPAPAEFHDRWERRSRSFEQSHEFSAKLGDAPIHLDMALAA